jgi:DNA repair protein RadC
MVKRVCYCDTASQIKVLDHIIIGENRYFSFADAGLVQQYNSDFLSLKEERRA